MRLIVGLGNPGPEYQWTPHNLGFLAVDEIANRASIRVERPEGKALVGLGKVAGEEVILAKPQTYMNLSGISVRDLLEKYELGPEDLLVMFDERDLPWGMIRIGERGSPGTHNGAKSVTSVVGTQEFARLQAAIEQAFQPEKVERFLKQMDRKGIRIRDFDAVLAQRVLDGDTAQNSQQLYQSLVLSDQAQMREFYLSKIEKVDTALRHKFKKLYQYY